MKCPNCGTKAEKDAEYCIACGVSLKKNGENNNKINIAISRSVFTVVVILIVMLCAVLTEYIYTMNVRNNELDKTLAELQESYWNHIAGEWDTVKIMSMDKDCAYISFEKDEGGNWNIGIFVGDRDVGGIKTFKHTDVKKRKITQDTIVIGDDMYKYTIDGDILTLNYKEQDNIFTKAKAIK